MYRLCTYKCSVHDCLRVCFRKKERKNKRKKLSSFQWPLLETEFDILVAQSYTVFSQHHTINSPIIDTNQISAFGVVIVCIEILNSFHITSPRLGLIITWCGHPTLPLRHRTLCAFVAKKFKLKRDRGEQTAPKTALPPLFQSQHELSSIIWSFTYLHHPSSVRVPASSYLPCQSGQAIVMLSVPVMGREATGTTFGFCIAKLLLMPRWAKTCHHFLPLLMTSNRSGVVCNWPSTGC